MQILIYVALYCELTDFFGHLQWFRSGLSNILKAYAVVLFGFISFDQTLVMQLAQEGAGVYPHGSSNRIGAFLATNSIAVEPFQILTSTCTSSVFRKIVY